MLNIFIRSSSIKISTQISLRSYGFLETAMMAIISDNYLFTRNVKLCFKRYFWSIIGKY